MVSAATTLPPLQKGERIEDWRHVFEAATLHIRGLVVGEKEAIQILTAYINRSIADREAVRDVTKNVITLEEALSSSNIP